MKCATCGRHYGGKQSMTCPHKIIDTEQFYEDEEPKKNERSKKHEDRSA